VAPALDVVVPDHDQMGRPGTDLLLAPRTTVALAPLAGDGLDLNALQPNRPFRCHGQGPFDGFRRTLALAARSMSSGHQPTTPRMKSAATPPTSLPISRSGRRCPRTRKE
jgi:hypothetical protein